jgi:hypothetical protein
MTEEELMIKKLEEKGYIIIESIEGLESIKKEEVDISDFEEMENLEIEKENLEKQKIKEKTFRPISIELYMENPELLMDSVVDACCKHDCVVEPDGYCEHGNPSVLLYHGMI